MFSSLHIQEWRHALRRSNSFYPFTSTAPLLRKKHWVIDSNREQEYIYCNSLPPNMFYKQSAGSTGWWVLNDSMLWTAHLDNATQEITYAGCSTFDPFSLKHKLTMRKMLEPLFSANKQVYSWDQRLETLGSICDVWMRRDPTDYIISGLNATGHQSIEYTPLHPRLHRIMSSCRLKNVANEMAISRLMEALWTDLQKDSLDMKSSLTEHWDLASSLIDNPWESWSMISTILASTTVQTLPLQDFGVERF